MEEPIAFATTLIEAIARETARSSRTGQAAVASPSSELREAIRSKDTPALFDWMIETFNFQGISDEVAASYLEAHGGVTWQQIKAEIGHALCPLLPSYWTYESCRYDKTRRTCRHRRHFRRCPVPSHPLRNGRLNQTAFSFFLFVRDVAGSDLFGWLDDQLATAADHNLAAQEAVVGPMRHIFGVSDKVLTMTLSSVLMADRKSRPDWFDVGSQMIVVDRLVHNLLVRTGILAGFDATHAYGQRCYGKNGCADILRRVSAEIDARQFDASFPDNFPRYIQHALWHYCAANGLNICNGNNIDDRKSCEQSSCIVYSICGRRALKNK
ncbi:hypothetical protein HU675_0020055 [Bradyrhizobium septentrionale]|uniref:hypothetical protein n=1 Tax=Bradyrhizobium septentrionale TaxID=1404411 RepID=UPI001CD3670B|nr:hypothetical protein [Bradyrhizobium septentrionale]UGY28877.1 hypothetical protein HU675_0020055 [Bradyrhizobium septentrionale]